MSSFNCEKCGTAILDAPGTGYYTECDHYPLETKGGCDHIYEKKTPWVEECKFCHICKVHASSKELLIELREEFDELFPKDQEAIDGIRPSRSNRSAALLLWAKFMHILDQVKKEHE